MSIIEKQAYYQKKIDELIKKIEELQGELLHYDSILQNYQTKLELLKSGECIEDVG